MVRAYDFFYILTDLKPGTSEIIIFFIYLLAFFWQVKNILGTP